MKDDLKEKFMGKLSELLDKPLMDAKIQINYHRDEVPAIRYDITEWIIPEQEMLNGSFNVK